MEVTKLTQDTPVNGNSDISTPKKAVSKKTANLDSKKGTSVEASAEASAEASSSASTPKKKSNETDGYKKIQLMIDTAKEEAIEELQKRTKKDIQEFKDSIMSDLQDIKNSIDRISSSKATSSKSSNDNGAAISNIAELLSKMNDLDTKINSSNEKQEFNFNWLKLALDGVLHKNDIDLDVRPVIKGDVKPVKKAPAKAKSTDSASVDLSTVKSTNFLKHQVLHDAEYIMQLFNNKEYEEHITNSICEHIKALPIASSFNKDAPVSEKVEFFTSYVRSNESASTKLFTLLNKNTTFKKAIASNFESWKAQNTVNVNKDFLGEEDA